MKPAIILFQCKGIWITGCWWTGKCGKTPAQFVLLCLALDGRREGGTLSCSAGDVVVKMRHQQMTSQLPVLTSGQTKTAPLAQRERTDCWLAGGARRSIYQLAVVSYHLWRLNGASLMGDDGDVTDMDLSFTHSAKWGFCVCATECETSGRLVESGITAGCLPSWCSPKAHHVRHVILKIK